MAETGITVLQYFDRVLEEMDRRYEERCSGQDKSLEAIRVHFIALMQASETKNQQQFADAEKAVKAALASAEQAVSKAEINSEKWRANANEWRAAMSDRENEFMRRKEAATMITALSDRVNMIEGRVTRNEGRGTGMTAVWGYIFAGLGGVATLITIFFLLTRR